MKIIFFGKLAEMIGREVEIAVAPGASIAQVRDALAAAFPAHQLELRGERSRACVGDRIVAEDHAPAPGEAVELLPPLSGG